MVVVFATVVPGILVVIPVMIAVVRAFAFATLWRDDTAGKNRHHAQQDAGYCNSMHICMLLNGSLKSRVAIRAKRCGNNAA
jgi:hypothetical protein